MTKHFVLSLAMAIAIAAGTVGDVMAAGPDSQGSQVNVTVKYTGPGTVDASHRVWVWLFDTPDIGPGSMPVAELTIEKNGATATFEGVSGARVWIAVAFDEHGSMSGNAPPPPGTPVGIYATATGAPEAVTVGDTKPVTVTFDDSLRMP
ncbi:MAG: hypothetical protein A3J29_04465 [Acidobacteria bacterium RIFCSPLOWO2_12_FULL_67_14b]|nr:MAG: hypothetical protein A3J29_04465 [Acidobacteria bacterium RIFCSPLOWO2_12_FULL_67_14b]